MSRLACGAFLAALTFAALGSPVPAHAGNGYHNIPGIACAAFNNYQANYLERNHVRLYNPVTSPQSIWVLCPMTRVKEDIDSTVSDSRGYLNIYYDASSPATAVNCVLRQYPYYTVAFPGTNNPYVQQTIASTRGTPVGTAGVNDRSFTITGESTSSWIYFTLACLLPPGTGVNSIDYYQQ